MAFTQGRDRVRDNGGVRTITVEQGGSPTTRWSAATTEPTLALLDDDVVGYTEYLEFSAGPVRRREVPTATSVLIVELGEPILAAGAVDHGRLRPATAFIGSPGRGPVETWHAGIQHCIEVRLTMTGVFRLARKIRHHAGRILPLTEAWGAAAQRLPGLLRAAGSAENRFDLLDDLLGSALATARPPDPEVRHAWHRLAETAGGIQIGTLAGEVGWSRGHLAERFRDQTGLTPKATGTLLRFSRAIDLLDAGQLPLPSIATLCGYYDQAHLNRDFRAFAGCTPIEWTRAGLTGLVGVGAAADRASTPGDRVDIRPIPRDGPAISV